VFSIAHSRSNYETFVRAGGKGEFIEFDARHNPDIQTYGVRMSKNTSRYWSQGTGRR
jgi:hypothetical protein